METHYSVIITNPQGQKQVATTDLSGRPFRSATSATLFANSFQECFPHYEYDIAPILNRTGAINEVSND